eukprot:1056144-Pyramimonas_sp.AAC.1
MRGPSLQNEDPTPQDGWDKSLVLDVPHLLLLGARRAPFAVRHLLLGKTPPQVDFMSLAKDSIICSCEHPRCMHRIRRSFL